MPRRATSAASSRTLVSARSWIWPLSVCANTSPRSTIGSRLMIANWPISPGLASRFTRTLPDDVPHKARRSASRPHNLSDFPGRHRENPERSGTRGSSQAPQAYRCSCQSRRCERRSSCRKDSARRAAQARPRFSSARARVGSPRGRGADAMPGGARRGLSPRTPRNATCVRDLGRTRLRSVPARARQRQPPRRPRLCRRAPSRRARRGARATAPHP